VFGSYLVDVSEQLEADNVDGDTFEAKRLVCGHTATLVRMQ